MHFNCSSSSRFTLILWNRSLSEKTALIQLWQKISADASAPLHCLHWLLGVSSTSFLRHQKPSTWILVHPACRVFTSLSDDDERSSSCLQTTAIAHPLLAADRLTVTTLTPQTRGLSQLTLSSTSHALWLTSCENILQPPPPKPCAPPALWERPYKEGWEGPRGESGAEKPSAGPNGGLLFGCSLTVNTILEFGAFNRLNLLWIERCVEQPEVLSGIYPTHLSGCDETSHIPKTGLVTVIMWENCYQRLITIRDNSGSEKWW